MTAAACWVALRSAGGGELAHAAPPEQVRKVQSRGVEGTSNRSATVAPVSVFRLFNELPTLTPFSDSPY